MGAFDLAGTIWILNTSVDVSTAFSYSINLRGYPADTSEVLTSYIALEVRIPSTVGIFCLSNTTQITSALYANGTIPNDFHRFIYIDGGEDVTNPNLITWLEANAVQVQVTSLAGTKWLFKSTLTIDTTIDKLVAFNANDVGYGSITADSSTGTLQYGANNVVYSNGNWSDDAERRIHMSSGSAISDPDLIIFMTKNAIIIKDSRPFFYMTNTSELTDIADSIRSVAGVSGSLTFLDGFISGIENAGGGYANITVDDYYNRNYTSVEAGVSEIGPGTFYNHSSLITASFPNCTHIGNCAFYYCSSLTTASFPSCITIGDYAFASCGSLTTISFPNCTSISSYAFAYCSSLTTASFPNCTSIGDEAFYNCSSLTTVSFPNCTFISGYAFGYCSSLTTVSFPECITIGAQAFYRCSLLTTISFPKCTTINTGAFYSCSSLTTVSFPSCTFIDDYAFWKCRNLTSLNLTGISSVPSLPYSTAFSSTPIAGYTTSTGGVYGSIYVPSSLLTSFKTATNWTYFSDRIVGV